MKNILLFAVVCALAPAVFAQKVEKKEIKRPPVQGEQMKSNFTPKADPALRGERFSKKPETAPDAFSGIPSSSNAQMPENKKLQQKIEDEISQQSPKAISSNWKQDKIRIERLGVWAIQLTNKYKDTVSALFEAKATDSEIKKALIVLNDLDDIKNVAVKVTDEKPSRHLWEFFKLYQKLTDGFAANKDVEERFEATNPAVVNILAKEIQKPIRVGWAHGKTIVVSTYIEENLNQAPNLWVKTLKTFNRDILNANH